MIDYHGVRVSAFELVMASMRSYYFLMDLFLDSKNLYADVGRISDAYRFSTHGCESKSAISSEKDYSPIQ